MRKLRCILGLAVTTLLLLTSASAQNGRIERGQITSEALVGTVQNSLNLLILQRKIGEMIAVFVNDGANRLKGSFYLSSPVIGDFETYITQDLVNLIDEQYRTLSARESRGVTGFSMGGWGEWQ